MARSSYSEPLHEKTFFQYVVILLIIGAFAFSLLAYLNTVYLRDTLVPKTIDVNDFLKKLTAHEEMGAFVGVSPLNIVQVNQNNIASCVGHIVIENDVEEIVFYNNKNKIEKNI